MNSCRACHHLQSQALCWVCTRAQEWNREEELAFSASWALRGSLLAFMLHSPHLVIIIITIITILLLLLISETGSPYVTLAGLEFTM